MPRRGWALPALFVLLALPLGLVLAPLIPPAEAPDEGAHVLRADSLLHGDLIGARAAIPTPDGPRVEALLHGDPGLRRLMLMALESPSVGHAEMQALRWGGGPELYPAQAAAYPPIFYAPSALGLLAAGRWTGAPPLDALFGARIANALAFVVVGGIALALARRGRLLMLAMLCLPMTLWLAASVHPDAPMLACLALVAALVGRWLAGERSRGRSVWIGAALLGCVIALKPSLFPMAGLLFLPLRRSAWVCGAAATRIGATALALVLGLGWTAYAQREVAVPFVRGEPYVAGPLFPGPAGTVFRTTDAAAQLRVLTADPLRLVTLPLRTIRDEADTKAREAVGVLGRLDLPLPGWLYALWAAALAGAALGDMLADERRDGPRVPETLLIVVIGVACLFATYLALYLSWTPVGAERIEGVQGRYLLPLLALLGLALPRVAVPRATVLRVGCTAVLVLAGLATTAILPVLVVRAYYAS